MSEVDTGISPTPWYGYIGLAYSQIVKSALTCKVVWGLLLNILDVFNQVKNLFIMYKTKETKLKKV